MGHCGNKETKTRDSAPSSSQSIERSITHAIRRIHVKRNSKWKRFSLAHFSYDNPSINGMAMIAGVIMLFAAMELYTYHYYK